MGRKAARITMERFKEIVEERKGSEDENYTYGPFDLYSLPERVQKDLAKVDFDGENQEWQQDSYRPDEWHGFQMIGDLPVLGASAGGDWEWPVYFILYWDGKQLRGYIPKSGNVWNHKMKTALGNYEEEDSEHIRKQLKKKFPDQEIPEDIHWSDINMDVLFSIEEMKSDIQKRIEVQ